MTNKIHPALLACDAVIIGTPIYFFNMSGQTKVFVDRWYALGGAEGYYRLKGKKAALAMAYADEDPLGSGAVNALRALQDSLNWVGIELVGVVHGQGEAKGDIRKDKRVLAAAKDLGRRLCS